MLHVNDDMDELFRKAAEDYPLNTKRGNFNKVLSKLPNSEASAIQHTTKKNNNYKLLFLLLLLPIGWICNEYNDSDNKFANTKNEVPGQSSAAVKADVPVTDNAKPLASEQESISRIDRPTEIIKKKIDWSDAAKNFTASKTGIFHPHGKKQKRSDSQTARTVKSVTEEKVDATSVVNDNELLAKEKNPVQQETPSNRIVEPRIEQELAKEKIQENQGSITAQTETIASSEASTVIKKLNDPRNKTPKFYAGLIGGLDISTIKFQSVKDHGFNAGVLAGYQLNKRLSIEASAFFVEKYYYSDAKHFDNTKPRLPYFVAVKTIEGECEMIELTLNGKYDFLSNNKRRWYAIAGVSSLLMESEYYSYKYVSSTTYYRYGEYDNKSTHLFSILNLGAGFEKSLTGKLRLRVEPYFKLPLSGVGIGNMPITSTGINLGITRRF